MPKAVEQLTSSRRDFLNSIGAIGASAAIPVGAAGSDAELIRLHAALARHAATLKRLGIEGRALPDRGPRSDANEAAVDAALDDWWDVMDRLQNLRAATPAGLRAKAGVMLMVLEQCACADAKATLANLDEWAEPHERFALSLARDVLAMGAGA